MKKLKLKISKWQSEGLMRNFSSMSVKNQKKFAPAVIMMMAVIVPTIKGKLDLSMKTNDGAFLFKAKAIYDALKNNASGFFSTPFANLALMLTQTDDYEAAIAAMQVNAPGSEGVKTEAKRVLKITLDEALAYVNNLAFLDQPNAVAIINAAGLQVINRSGVNKQELSVKQGAAGEAKLASRAAKYNGKRVKAYYEWQYSTDNGVNWNSIPTTVVAKTVATGMQTDVKTFFRKRSSTVKGGISDWCAPISITLV